MNKDDKERFISKIDIVSINGKMFKSNRIAWEIFRGPIPNGMLVLHKCDNKLCNNPDHLYLGTHADNLRDRQTRNPVSIESYGSGKAKLYEGEIWLIRKLNIPSRDAGGANKHKFSSSLIAKMFKVSPGTILRIWNSDSYLCKEGYYI